MGLLARGEKARHFGETKMNVNSSRSHTVFRMVPPPPPPLNHQSDAGVKRHAGQFSWGQGRRTSSDHCIYIRFVVAHVCVFQYDAVRIRKHARGGGRSHS